jgi:general stress protein 26
MASSARSFAEVIEVARPIVERIIWCTVTTVSSDGTPRSRLMHPVWFWDDDAPQALVTARPTPIKVAHLAAHPTVSCFYWDPAHDTVAIDATASWLDRSQHDDAWRRIASVAPPVGFDPAIVWPEGPTSADCAFLMFEPHRIVATPAGRPGSRWTLPIA